MGEKTANPGHFTIPTAPAAGTSCTSGAANVFTTTYVVLSASAPSTLFITGIHVEAAAAKAATYIIAQLATGTAGNEVIIGQYLCPLSTASTVALGYRAIYPPVPVASGIRITCKTADSVGAAATLITLECIAQASVVDDGVAVATVTTVTNQLTAAAIATGVWQDTTAGDFTTASSIGKSLFTTGAVPGAANGLQIAGANAATTYATLTSTGAFTVGGVSSISQTGDGFAVVKSGGTGDNAAIKAAIGTAGAGLTALGDTRIGNLDAAVSGRMATYTQPTGFLAATFPSGTVANTTNITAGTITTATNLTNAVASVTGAVGSVTGAVGSVTGAVGSVTGNVGGNVVGSVASVTAGVTLAASQHVIVDSGTVTTLTNLPAIPAAWLTATGIAASALNDKGNWNVGKTGYSLTQAFPANFSAQAISAAGVADANIKSVAGTTVNGSGTAVSPWGP